MDKWDKRGLLQAKFAASFSKDPSTQVGAALRRKGSKKFASIGYNGFAPGVDDSMMIQKPFKYNAVLHAEVNALDNCKDPDCDGYTMYVWGLACCGPCMAKCISNGITKVVALQEVYRADWAENLEAAVIQAKQVGLDYQVYEPNQIDSLILDIKFPNLQDD